MHFFNFQAMTEIEGMHFFVKIFRGYGITFFNIIPIKMLLNERLKNNNKKMYYSNWKTTNRFMSPYELDANAFSIP